MSNELQKIDQKPIQELTERIALLHSEALAGFKIGIDKAIEIGGLLTLAKKKIIPFGQFGEFCKTLPFSERTCQNYMRVYKYRELTKTESLSDLNSIYEFLKVPLEQEEITPSQESEIVLQTSQDPIENEEQTVMVSIPEVTSEPAQTISVTINEERVGRFDYGKWHRNQAKTNSIANKALELCFALERQPLENVGQIHEGWLADNLRLVIKNMFDFIANGTQDTDGIKTTEILTKWVREAQETYLREKANSNTHISQEDTVDGEVVSTEPVKEVKK